MSYYSGDHVLGSQTLEVNMLVCIIVVLY